VAHEIPAGFWWVLLLILNTKVVQADVTLYSLRWFDGRRKRVAFNER